MGLVVMFFGCRQTAHIEANKYNIEPNKVDTTLVVHERIVDTIPIISDSVVETQCFASPTTDSISETYDIPSSELDSINLESDSINND